MHEHGAHRRDERRDLGVARLGSDAIDPGELAAELARDLGKHGAIEPIALQGRESIAHVPRSGVFRDLGGGTRRVKRDASAARQRGQLIVGKPRITYEVAAEHPNILGAARYREDTERDRTFMRAMLGYEHSLIGETERLADRDPRDRYNQQDDEGTHVFMRCNERALSPHALADVAV